MTNLEKAYSPENFRDQAHKLVDHLADYLSEVLSRNHQVIPYKTPEESLAYWQADFNEGPNEDTSVFFNKVIEKATHLHHPRYMGHQVGVVAPITAVASMLDSLLNNGMAVYEMGMVANPLERLITELMATRIGFDKNAGGILTSGGTLANLTALLSARAKHAKTDVWQEGSSQKLAIIVSKEAHYCIDRAARIMGLGTEGIIKIPVNDRYQMRTELLEKYYNDAIQNGLDVIAIIGSSCSTSTGSYDDLTAIGKFAKEKNIWFHVDGAHGGAVIFSEKNRYKVQGIEAADSVVIDWHKMLMTPALITALIFKENNDSYQTFHQKAQYLWGDQSSQEWFNSGKRTFECTKSMMCIKVYAILKTYGEEVFAEYVDYLYNLGHQFGEMIMQHNNFELGVEPECNIVCFKPKNSSNEVTQALLKKLVEKGKFYIVRTTLKEQTYLRVSLMNPMTTIDDLKDLLVEIESHMEI
jgi:L-2,4-diaminobutyrate decarboxylase